MDILPGKEDKILNNRSKKKAEKYLKEKHIMSLVNHLISMLLLHEPKDPIAFLKLQTEHLINFRDNRGKPPILFTNNHLVDIFRGVDCSKQGSIDLEQYFNAMHILELDENYFNRNPQVNENNRVECKVFVYEAKRALVKQLTTITLLQQIK